MPTTMTRGLAPKLILSVTSIVLLVVGIFAFINARIQEQELRDQVVQSADQLSNTVAGATWHAMLADQRETAYQVMRTIGNQEGVRRVRIFNKLGEITFSTGPDGGTMVDQSAEACDLCHAAGEPLVKPNVQTRVREFNEDGHHLLGYVTPIYNEPACSTAGCHAHPEGITVLGVLDISVPLDLLDQEVSGIRTRAVLVAVITVVLIAFFVVFFTRHFVQRPVRELTRATESVGRMQLSQPIVVRSKDELGELGKSFDNMREQLLTAHVKIEDFTRNLERKVAERTEELEETQKRLSQSERLASLGRLAASVAHEINNPLSGVLNYGALMQRLMAGEGIPPERLEDFRHYLSRIISETSRAGRIVTDLLSFSRRSSASMSREDLNAVVERTIEATEHRLSEAGVEVRFELHPALPPVTCDASPLQQVVTNLLLNAADASGEGDTVTLRTRPDDDDGAVLVVEDRGEGIEEENLTRIFDPFFTTKEDGKGIGLGLAVVYGIVETHGGSIEVASRPGQGTIFTVHLPGARKPAAEEE
jgi:two-component system, NtrC family, sensor kinase